MVKRVLQCKHVSLETNPVKNILCCFQQNVRNVQWTPYNHKKIDMKYDKTIAWTYLHQNQTKLGNV